MRLTRTLKMAPSKLYKSELQIQGAIGNLIYPGRIFRNSKHNNEAIASLFSKALIREASQLLLLLGEILGEIMTPQLLRYLRVGNREIWIRLSL